MENVEKLRDDWRELRSQLGNFICRMDNRLKFIETHADQFITHDEHKKECDKIFDAAWEGGVDEGHQDYVVVITELRGLDSETLFDLFEEEDPTDILYDFCIDSINKRLSNYYKQQEQIQKEAARDAADHEINEWFRQRSNELVEEYTKRKRDIGVQVDRITFDRKEHTMEGQE